jgi:hypothetical protein
MALGLGSGISLGRTQGKRSVLHRVQWKVGSLSVACVVVECCDKTQVSGRPAPSTADSQVIQKHLLERPIIIHVELRDL